MGACGGGGACGPAAAGWAVVGALFVVVVDPMGDNDDTVEGTRDAVDADTTAIGGCALGLVLMVVLVLLPNVLTIVLEDLHLFKLLLRCSLITSVMLFLFVDLDEENPEDGVEDCTKGFCCTTIRSGALELLTAVVDLLVLLELVTAFETLLDSKFEFVMVFLDGAGFVVPTL